jgi:hypothetical protein
MNIPINCMSGLILPYVDFTDLQKPCERVKECKKPIGSSNNDLNGKANINKVKTNIKSTKMIPKMNTKNIKQKSTINTIIKSVNIKKQQDIKTKATNDSKSESNSDSEIDIDEIDNLIYKDGYPSSEESESSEPETKIVCKAEPVCTSPPVYDGEEPYYLFKRRWDAYINNKLTQTLHMHILSFINTLFDSEYTSLISIKKIDEKKIPAPKYVVDLIKEDNNYRKLFKIKYSLNIPSPKMIDSLLNKINFSFVKMENKKSVYYCIKSGIISRLKY